MKKKVKSSLNFLKKLFMNRLFQLFILVFVIDRITKIFALNKCPCIVAPFLNIVRVANRGIAFGMFKGANSNIIFSIIAIFAVVLLYYFAFVKLDGKTNASKGIRLGIVFMIAGALGNIIDRLFFGFVLDIFSFHLGIWYFPAFNIADASITFGAIVAIMYSLFEDKLNAKKNLKSNKSSTNKPVKKEANKKIANKKASQKNKVSSKEKTSQKTSQKKPNKKSQRK